MTREDVGRLVRWFVVCLVLACIMGTAGLVGALVLVMAALR